MDTKEEDFQLEVKFINFLDKNLALDLIGFFQRKGYAYTGSSGKENETTLKFLKVV